MESDGRRPRGDDPDFGWKRSVESSSELPDRQPCGQFDAGHLTRGVYAGIRSSGAMGGRMPTCYFVCSFFQTFLNRQAVALPLPAAERAAVVLYK